MTPRTAASGNVMRRMLKSALKLSLLVGSVLGSSFSIAEVSQDSTSELLEAASRSQASLSERLDQTAGHTTANRINGCSEVIAPLLKQFKKLSDHDAPEVQLGDVRDNIVERLVQCVDATDAIWGLNLRTTITYSLEKERLESCKVLNGKIQPSNTVRKQLESLRAKRLNSRSAQLRTYGELGYTTHLANMRHVQVRYLQNDVCHQPSVKAPHFIKEKKTS